MSRWSETSRPSWCDWDQGWLRLGRWWYTVQDWRLVRVPLVTGGMTDPTIDQNVWAEVVDDGDEAGSTITQEQTIDGGWTQAVDVVFRARFEMVNTAGDSANGRTYELQFDHELAGYVAVGAATAIQFAASAEDGWTITPADATTDRLAGDGGTFTAGEYAEANPAGSTNVGALEHNEVEYCLTIDSAQVANGEEILLRVVCSGALTASTYGATPTITVSESADTSDVESAARFHGPMPVRRTGLVQPGGMTPPCFEEPPILVGKAA